MGRKRLETEEVSEGGSYFEPPSSVEKFSSGCTLLDCVLGGGWPEGKMSNIVGDSGSGKSLLAMEAAANFLLKHPNGQVHYIETEQAFDPAYADSLGIPVESITLVNDIFTVEDLFKYLEQAIGLAKGGVKLLVIVDSLDALSDKAELERGIDEGTFGASKAKQLSQLFRRLHSKMGQSDMTLFIVSQVRDNIGVAFGEKHSRAGGKALKFYSTVEVWLANLGQIKQQVEGVKRSVGVNIRAKTKKNRLAAPFRECDFPIIFNYGVDDVKACLEFLESVKRLDAVGENTVTAYIKKLGSLNDVDRSTSIDYLRQTTKRVWDEIEQKFQPTRRKYA